MMPLLIVALLIWAGVFAFIFGVDRRLSELEKRYSLHNGKNDTENGR
jgi:hypothetical protein